jgi:hypothetical protein
VGKLDSVNLKELGVVLSIIGTIGSVWYTAGRLEERLISLSQRIERLENHEDSHFSSTNEVESTQAPGGSRERYPVQQREEVAFVVPEVHPHRISRRPRPLPGGTAAD